MKERTPDRRVQRTRRLLHKALMSRVLEKKYESITVQEILDRADVGRSTFYTHFQDKDELLVSGFENVKNLRHLVLPCLASTEGRRWGVNDEPPLRPSTQAG